MPHPLLNSRKANSTLHKAAIYGRRDVCDFLFERAHCNQRAQFARDLLNQMPSDMARYNGHPHLATRLRHLEDVLWHAPVLWQPAPLDAAPSQTKGAPETSSETAKLQPTPSGDSESEAPAV